MEPLEGFGAGPSSSCGHVAECEALTPSFVSLEADSECEDWEEGDEEGDEEDDDADYDTEEEEEEEEQQQQGGGEEEEEEEDNAEEEGSRGDLNGKYRCMHHHLNLGVALEVSVGGVASWSGLRCAHRGRGFLGHPVELGVALEVPVGGVAPQSGICRGRGHL